MKLDETRIQHHLNTLLDRKGHYIVIPNVDWSYLLWEADLISVTQAWYLHEYEIKISHQDFKADFKKPKHKHYRARRNHKRMPNYFTYVAPIKAIPICIPEYAGLIEVQECGHYGHDFCLIQVKKPVLIHKNKLTEAGAVKMLRTFMFKYWRLATTLDTIKIQKELFHDRF